MVMGQALQVLQIQINLKGSLPDADAGSFRWKRRVYELHRVVFQRPSIKIILEGEKPSRLASVVNRKLNLDM